MRTKLIALVTALFLIPASASAVTVLTNGGTQDILSDNVFVFEALLGDAGVTEFSFNFTHTPPPTAQPATAVQLTLSGFGVAAGAQMNWATTDLTYNPLSGGFGPAGSILSDAVPTDIGPFGIMLTASTVFDAVNGFAQTLNIGFASVAGPVQLSLQVIPTPIPAAAWMFLTALGGLGAVGMRRRKRATA